MKTPQPKLRMSSSLMRNKLIAAVALAPLCLAANAAWATSTTITQSTTVTASTTPLQTATIAAGGSDITIGSGGNVSAAASGTTSAPIVLLTLNSNNNITNSAGTVASSQFNNVTGVLGLGGYAGSIENQSVISLTTTFTAPTTADGYAQGPFAGTASPTLTTGTGDYGLYGIRVTGSSALAGSIDNASSASITIKGNNSYGISVEAGLTGALTSEGSITLTGDNGAAINIAEYDSAHNIVQVGASFQISGAISATGQNSSAVIANGDVLGRLSLYSTVTATDYAITSRVSNLPLLAKLETAANNQTNFSGAAMIVGGNVGAGFYIGGAPSGTVSGSEVNLTGDGIPDGSEVAGSITSYGSAPALVFGAADRNITISGYVDLTGNTQDNGFGFVNRGTVSASGVYDNVSTTALQFGLVGGGNVNLSYGATIFGSVTASSYGGIAGVTSTAIQINNATIPTLNLFGTVSAGLSALTSTTTPSTGEVGAYAINASSAAQLGVLMNTGIITAAAVGNFADAYAVKDASGTLKTITNEGVISATSTAASLGTVQQGATVAFDLSKNTTGISLLQTLNPSPNHAYGSVSGATTTATTTFTAVTPTISGDVLLGKGANTVDLESGSLTGALDMGGANVTSGSVLTLNNGAALTGALTFEGSGLKVNILSGKLDDRSPSVIQASSLNIGATGALSFNFDPAKLASTGSIATQFIVTGAAINGTSNVVVAKGASFGLTALSLPTVGQTYTVNVISSNLLLTLNGSTAISLTSSPYLLNPSLALDSTGDNLTLTVALKSPAQLGLNKSEAALMPALLTAAPKDSEVQAALLAPTSHASFLKVYDAFLPDSTGGVFEAARLASDAVSKATATYDASPGAGGTRNYWMQEFVIGSHSDRTSANTPFDVGGFGAVAGAAMGGYGFGAVGVTAALASSTVTDAELKGAGQQAVSSFEAGVYWQATLKRLTLDLRAGAGAVSINGTRQLFAYDSTTDLVSVNRTVKDNRSGYTATLHGGASYSFDLPYGLFLRPQVRSDYFYMSEDSYHESDPVATTVGFPSAFALSVNSRNGSELTSKASFALGANWGQDFRVRPELELGLVQSAGDPGKTTAQFVAGGSPFTLTPDPMNGVGGLARFSVKASTNFYEVAVQAGAEMHDRYYAGDARVTIRLMF